MTRTQMNDIFPARAQHGRLIAVFAAALAVMSGCASLRPSIPDEPEVGEAAALLGLGAPTEGEDRDRTVAPALKDYREYWRRHRLRVVRAHHKEILEAGEGDWGAGYRALLDTLYTEENFREAAQILHDGLTGESDGDRESLESALVSHRVARLTYLALVAEKRADKDSSWRQTAEEARRRLRAVRDRQLPENDSDASPSIKD